MKESLIFVKNPAGEPCWESWKIIREYTAPNTVDSPTMGNNQVDHFIREVNIIISPIRFGDGGSPKFDAHIKSHHMVLKGKISFSPRVIARVRVPFRSYTVLARENRADETSPWAIINMRAPFRPHVVWENMPAATILMCPTDE